MKYFCQNETWLHELYLISYFFLSEFLDAKDPSLAFAVYGASQLNIFPIAVLDVTTADSNMEELLLCFNGKLSDCVLKTWIHPSTFRATLNGKGEFSCLQLDFTEPQTEKKTTTKATKASSFGWKILPFNFRVWCVCKQLWLSQQEKAFDVEQTATCLWWVLMISPFSK